MTNWRKGKQEGLKYFEKRQTAQVEFKKSACPIRCGQKPPGNSIRNSATSCRAFSVYCVLPVLWAWFLLSCLKQPSGAGVIMPITPRVSSKPEASVGSGELPIRTLSEEHCRTHTGPAPGAAAALRRGGREAGKSAMASWPVRKKWDVPREGKDPVSMAVIGTTTQPAGRETRWVT